MLPIFFPTRSVLNMDARLCFLENHAEDDLVPYKMHNGARVYKSMTAAAYRMWRRQVAPLSTWISSVCHTIRWMLAALQIHVPARVASLTRAFQWPLISGLVCLHCGNDRRARVRNDNDSVGA